MRKAASALCLLLAALVALSSCAAVGVPAASPELSSPQTTFYPSQSETVSPSEQIAGQPSPSAADDSSVLPSPSSQDTPSQPPAPQSASPSAPQPSPSPPPETETVTVSALGPDDAVVLELITITYTEGMTALDALLAACEETGTEIHVTGDGQTAYVKALGGYAEHALSGWVYKVSGVYMSVGLGSAKLVPGDRVAMYFSLNLGKDVMSRED